MADPLDWIDQALDQLSKSGLMRSLSTRSTPQSPSRFELNQRPLLNFGSNDYLGFASENLLEAVRASIDRYGWGSGASPLLGGRSEDHAALESETARFEGTESALVFPSGFAANVGCIASLVSKGDVVFSDAHNHASIIDGCRLSRARVVVYAHNDMSELKRHLREAGSGTRRLIVTDSLFSMHGDVAPLADLADIASRYQAMLMVDEAHATGVFGQRGRGLCERAGIAEGGLIRVGTYSKALGSHGGFVAGQARLIRWLVNRARPYFFSTAAPSAVAAASRAALQLVDRQPHRRQTLLENAERLRESLRERGWNIGNSTSQIIPVIVGDDQAAMRVSERLSKGGVFVPGIRPPTVPIGQALVRVSLSYGHSDEQIDRLLQTLGGPDD